MQPLGNYLRSQLPILQEELTWSLDTEPTNGEAQVSGKGSSPTVNYTSIANYFGDDSFIIQVEDESENVTKLTVNVTVTPVNDAPTISLPQGQIVALTQLSISVLPTVTI